MKVRAIGVGVGVTLDWWWCQEQSGVGGRNRSDAGCQEHLVLVAETVCMVWCWCRCQEHAGVLNTFFVSQYFTDMQNGVV